MPKTTTMENSMMQAIVATAYGGPEVFKLQSVPKPVPKANEILVCLRAASITRADTMIRTGKPYIGRLMLGWNKPKHPIPGTGFAGVVEAIGAEVTTFKIGDRVCGEATTNFSTNAEYLSISAEDIILHMPENLDYAQAAVLCDGPLTSYNFLHQLAKLKAGDRILINGGSGALGTAAIQLAKNLGAEVTAVCSHRNSGLVQSLGADQVVDYSKQDFTRLKQKFDVVYDTVGKSSFRKSRKVLDRDGLYMSPVLNFSLLLRMFWTGMFSRQKAKFSATGMLATDQLREMLSHLLELFKEGVLKMVIDRQYPLAKVAEAHTYIDTGHKKGNIVIVFPTNEKNHEYQF